jgi:hypothetical protein
MYNCNYQVEKDEMDGARSANGTGEESIWVIVCKAERILGRPRRNWADNIKMDIVETKWGGVDWIGLAQDRDRWRALVNSVMSPRVL